MVINWYILCIAEIRRTMIKRILIANDEPLECFLMSRALVCVCDFHGEIKIVRNGKDAIKEIIRCAYSICFLDMNLPDLDGLDVMKHIKKISPETNIVLMTAGSVSDDVNTTIEGYASLLASKPIDLFQIKTFVKLT